MKHFLSLTAAGQVRRLRRLAEAALERYPIRWSRIAPLDHGENTTFKVWGRLGRQRSDRLFNLRVHRAGYHSGEGIDIELRWLRALRQDTEIVAPLPIAGRDGIDRQRVSVPGVPEPRDCDLLTWVEGRFRWDTLRRPQAVQAGRLLGTLQQHTRDLDLDPDGLRPRWDAQGLVGRKSNWGTLRDLPGASSAQTELLEQCRRKVHRHLRRLEKRGEDFGLIHSDLHFQNVLFDAATPYGACPIDFDDCGHGHLLYDLAVPICAVPKHPQFGALRDGLIEGWLEGSGRSDIDENALETLLVARRLTIVAWVASRSDNPGLAPYMGLALKRGVHAAERHLAGERLTPPF